MNGRFLRLILGLLAVGALLWMVDTHAVLEQAADVHLPWVLATGALLTIATFIGALNAYLLISPVHTIRFAEFLRLYWLAWAVGLFVPGQIGDLATISLALNRRGLPWAVGLGRSLADKFISAVVLGLCGAAGFVRALGPPTALSAIAAFGVVLGLTPALPHLLKRWGLLQLRPRPLARALDTLSSALAQIADVARRHPLRVTGNAVLTIAKVGITGAAYWCAFAALGDPNAAPLHDVIMLAAASALIAYVPVSVNGLGTVEAAGIVLFSSVGLSADLVLSAYLLLRLLVLALAWTPSAAIFLRR